VRGRGHGGAGGVVDGGDAGARTSRRLLTKVIVANNLIIKATRYFRLLATYLNCLFFQNT
jgi:hypothetical protein